MTWFGFLRENALIVCDPLWEVPITSKVTLCPWDLEGQMLFLVFPFARIIQSFENNFSRTTGRMVFLGGTSGEEAVCQCRRCKRLRFDPWVRKILWRREWQPISILTWRIPWAEELDRLQSTGSQRVRHNWSDLAYTNTCIHTYAFSYIYMCIHKCVCIHNAHNRGNVT